MLGAPHAFLLLSVLPHPRGHTLSAVARIDFDVLDVSLKGVPPQSTHMLVTGGPRVDYMVRLLPSPDPISRAAYGWLERELHGVKVIGGAHVLMSLRWFQLGTTALMEPPSSLIFR